MSTWFCNPDPRGMSVFYLYIEILKSFIPLPNHLSTPILEEYVPLRLK
jgi:hypothetical protein